MYLPSLSRGVYVNRHVCARHIRIEHRTRPDGVTLPSSPQYGISPSRDRTHGAVITANIARLCKPLFTAYVAGWLLQAGKPGDVAAMCGQQSPFLLVARADKSLAARWKGGGPPPQKTANPHGGKTLTVATMNIRIYQSSLSL